jgi:hypothetical protein
MVYLNPNNNFSSGFRARNMISSAHFSVRRQDAVLGVAIAAIHFPRRSEEGLRSLEINRRKLRCLLSPLHSYNSQT